MWQEVQNYKRAQSTAKALYSGRRVQTQRRQRSVVAALNATG